MSEFQREDRYLVLKRSDIEMYAPDWLRANLTEVVDDLNYYIHEGRLKDDRKIIGRKFIVIENDWPEYEVVWRMIEARIAKEKGDDR